MDIHRVGFFPILFRLSNDYSAGVCVIHNCRFVRTYSFSFSFLFFWKISLLFPIQLAVDSLGPHLSIFRAMYSGDEYFLELFQVQGSIHKPAVESRFLYIRFPPPPLKLFFSTPVP